MGNSLSQFYVVNCSDTEVQDIFILADDGSGNLTWQRPNRDSQVKECSYQGITITGRSNPVSLSQLPSQEVFTIGVVTKGTPNDTKPTQVFGLNDIIVSGRRRNREYAWALSYFGGNNSNEIFATRIGNGDPVPPASSVCPMSSNIINFRIISCFEQDIVLNFYENSIFNSIVNSTGLIIGSCGQIFFNMLDNKPGLAFTDTSGKILTTTNGQPLTIQNITSSQLNGMNMSVTNTGITISGNISDSGVKCSTTTSCGTAGIISVDLSVQNCFTDPINILNCPTSSCSNPSDTVVVQPGATGLMQLSVPEGTYLGSSNTGPASIQQTSTFLVSSGTQGDTVFFRVDGTTSTTSCSPSSPPDSGGETNDDDTDTDSEDMNGDSTQDNNNGVNRGAIIAIVIGVILLAIFIIILVIWFSRRGKKKDEEVRRKMKR